MKIPAEFAPKSWEMPPGFRVMEESASVVTREFDGEKLDWLVALVGIPTLEHPITWVRPLDSRFDAGFVVLGIHNKSPFVITRHHPLNASDTLLFVMCQHHRLGRCLFFNKDGNLRQHGEEALGAVVFSANGMASWLVDTLADDEKMPVPFRWNKVLTIDEFFHLSANQIWSRLQQLLGKPNRKISFARQFAFADEKTRQDLVFEFAPLDRKGFGDLSRSLIYSQRFWNDSDVEAEIFMLRGKKPRLIINRNGRSTKVLTGLNRSFDLLWWHFQPVRAALTKYPSVVNWLNERSENIGDSFSSPTAHEQLEAALRWHEWEAKHEKL